MAESEVELKSLLMRVREESETFGLKLSVQKTKIMAFGPVTSWQIWREKVEAVADFIFLSSTKSLWTVTSALKLKDSCSLEGKLWQTYAVYSKAETPLCWQKSYSQRFFR